MGSARPPITSITAVVPAHNEEDLLGACLRSLREAARQVDVPVRVLVVLDRCTDGSAEICTRHAVTALQTDAANVGHARAAGFALALADADETAWLSSTDADTTVPPDWFARQLELAALGADAIVGIVKVDDWGGYPAADRARFEARYESPSRRTHRASPQMRLEVHPDGHPHVHGANLGVRASAYVAAGGYQPLRAHEDRALVRALDALPEVTVVRTTKVVVATSARTTPRAPHGFGALLRRIASTSEATCSAPGHAASDRMP